MSGKVNRRHFFQGSLSLTSLLLTQCKSVGGSSDTLAEKSRLKRASAATPQLRIRRSLTAGTGGSIAVNPAVKKDLELYSKAVDLMKKASDQNTKRTAWETQARIHQDYCPHGNWYFLPWHRWYLYYFEDQCRFHLKQAAEKITDKNERMTAETEAECFALPYWNWFESPSIPEAFFVSDSLKNNSRRVNPRSRLAADVTGAAVAKRIEGIKDFDAFASGRADRIRDSSSQGMLEATPHNGVHVFVNGDMGSFMSPLDPIFWMHHCHVDKIWAEWATKNPTLALPDAPNAADGDNPAWTADFWKAKEVGNFIDRTGKNDVKKTIGDALDFRSLGFSYDILEAAPASTRNALAATETPPESLGLASAAPRKRVKFDKDEIGYSVNGSIMTIALPDKKNGAAQTKMNNLLINFANRIKANKPSLFTLNVQNIAIPDNKNVRLIGYLYLGEPGQPTKNYDADPNLIGSISFFGHNHDEGGQHPETMNAIFDVTDVMTGLIRNASKGPLYLVILATDDPNKDVDHPSLPPDVLKRYPIEIVLKVNAS